MPTLSTGQELPYPGDPGAEQSPLEALQAVIQDMHALMAALPDAKHTSVVAKSLAALLPIQEEIMGAGQATTPDPRQALLAQLGGQ